MTRRHLAAATLTAVLAGGPALAASPDVDPAAQKAAQQKALADAEATARRVATALRVVQFQKIDQTAETKVLKEVADQLKGLTDDQMKAVLDHLDKAVKAPDEKTASAEQKAAYDKHRQVVSSLRGMLTRLDVLKSLDHAAEKLEKYARDQHDLALKSTASHQFANASRTKRYIDDREELADAQTDLRAEMTAFVGQTADLKAKLTPEQKERLAAAEVGGRGGKIIADMELSKMSVMQGDYKTSADRQLGVAKDLQAMAAALRTPKDKLAALKDARDKVEKVIAAEQQLKKDTEEKKADRDPDTTNVRDPRNRQDPAKEIANKLADRQAKVEFDARDARKAVEQVAKDVAAKITPAESEMRRAEDELRRNQDRESAAEAEQKATDRLKDAKDELDKLIAQAEKERTDALAATKKALEEVNKLIQDQKAAQEQTKKNADKPDALKPAADKQKDVAKAANEVKDLPLPDKPEVKDALKKAADEAKKAAEALAKKDAKAADPKQNDTLKALTDA